MVLQDARSINHPDCSADDDFRSDLIEATLYHFGSFASVEAESEYEDKVLNDIMRIHGQRALFHGGAKGLNCLLPASETMEDPRDSGSMYKDREVAVHLTSCPYTALFYAGLPREDKLPSAVYCVHPRNTVNLRFNAIYMRAALDVSDHSGRPNRSIQKTLGEAAWIWATYPAFMCDYSFVGGGV